MQQAKPDRYASARGKGSWKDRNNRVIDQGSQDETGDKSQAGDKTTDNQKRVKEINNNRKIMKMIENRERPATEGIYLFFVTGKFRPGSELLNNHTI